ncbi:hypothetical protein [Myroides profundi]|uniref:hypothetical protein n=1 Tax=Myroides profundi TaxID=480520 RepID=UPI0005A30D75|nr:hypothetical protein [Myroides profundi]AJH13749.1 hypothetical protein MPR_0540 [Myroides profundi]
MIRNSEEGYNIVYVQAIIFGTMRWLWNNDRVVIALKLAKNIRAVCYHYATTMQ